MLAGGTAEGARTPAASASPEDTLELAGNRASQEVFSQGIQSGVPLEEPMPQEDNLMSQVEEKPQQPATEFANSTFDFILNPDLEEAFEDYSSSEEEESE